MYSTQQERLRHLSPACASRWLRPKQEKGVVERPLKQGYGLPLACGPPWVQGRRDSDCICQALSGCQDRVACRGQEHTWMWAGVEEVAMTG